MSSSTESRMIESADSQMDRLKSPLEGKLEALAHALEAFEPGTAGTAISSTAPGGKREPMATGEEEDNADSGGDGDVTVPKVFHTSWRLHGLTAVLCISLLLSTLETTIVGTSLVSIVNSLEGFDMSGWIVTSYFLTYAGFLVIYARLGGIVGYKLMLLCALTFFTVFSLACGFANSMLQLIIFRAFQGIGGSGIYSLCTVMVPLMVPPAKYATYIAVTSSMFVLSSVLGPVIGGAIVDHTTWRWVFLLNGPGGLLAALLLTISIPFGFPYGYSQGYLRSMISDRAWRRIDYLGALLLLGASVTLIFALQQGGVAYAWNSVAIIVTFTLSGLLWLGFLAWQRQLSLWNTVLEPIFPWRVACNRFVLGLLGNGFLTGFPFMAAIINIPQRLQTVNDTSAIGAGLRMLPLLLLSPVASSLSGFFISKLRWPPLYLLILGGSLQTIGVGLFSSLSSWDLTIPNAQYGYQVIMGLGFGLNLSTILIMAPMVVKEKDMPVTMAAVTQIRVVGGTIGLAVCSALLNNHIKTDGRDFLTPHQIASILTDTSNIALLPPELQHQSRSLFAAAYSQQMRVMMYFAIASLLSLLLLVERRPRRLVDTKTAQVSGRR